MTSERPRWPETTGASLLLVPLASRGADWASAEERVRTAIRALNVEVARGLAFCPAYVRAGIEGAPGVSGEEVLVFACPADIGIYEAAPLVSAGETGLMLDEVGRFFRDASRAALKLAPKIAWVAAHEWSADDRVRWDSGDIDALVKFATSPGAWRTCFLGRSAGQVDESGEWPYWFEVSS